jgi:hypothetical protein
MTASTNIKQAAILLIVLHGDDAFDYASRRISELKTQGDTARAVKWADIRAAILAN